MNAQEKKKHEEFQKRAQIEAQKMTDAFYKKNFDRFIDYLHPSIVEMSGGREQMKESFSGGIAPNTTLESSEVNYPRQALTHMGLCQYVMSQKQILTIWGTSVYTISDLIGLYNPLSEEWKFVGATNNSIEKINQLLPEISLVLKLNQQTRPIRITN